MKLKNIFPFDISEYLKVFGYFVIFIVIFYLSKYLFSLFIGSIPEAAGKDIIERYAVTLFFLILGLVILNILIYTFLITLSYGTITRKKFRWQLWSKYNFALLFLILIFILPLFFSMRLMADGNVAGTVIFLIFVVAAFHFSNLIYLFVAITGKTFQGIKKGLYQGTVKILKLIVPYIFVLIGSAVFSFIIRFANNQFANMVLSGIFLSWAALYIGRTIISQQK